MGRNKRYERLISSRSNLCELLDKVKGDDLPTIRLMYWILKNAGPDNAKSYKERLDSCYGGIGPNTLKKVAEYVEANGIEQSIENFQQARQSYYEQLSTFATFGKGWTRRVNETTELAKTMV